MPSSLAANNITVISTLFLVGMFEYMCLDLVHFTWFQSLDLVLLGL